MSAKSFSSVHCPLVLLRQVKIASSDNVELSAPCDVLIEEGLVKQIAPSIEAPADAQIYEGGGDKILLPALFDAHVHFREPGGDHKETLETGAQSAINGGITGIVCMPNTTPAIDSVGTVKQLLDNAAEVSPIEIYTSACVTRGRAGKEITDIGALHANGIVMLTDDGDTIEDISVLYQAMQYGAPMDMLFASHCETNEIAGDRAMNLGALSYKLGIAGTPPCSEEIALNRDIALAHATGARIHIQHLTTKIGMELVGFWKERGAKVTAEVSPHHLLFTQDDIADYDTHYKMNPPLRTAEDNAALLQGLIDGTIDMLATDHAPHSPFEKSLDFVAAPNGIIGLDTALICLYDALISQGKLSWQRLVQAYCDMPRTLMNLPVAKVAVGEPVNMILFDPNVETLVDRAFIKSKSENTPYLNKTLQGSVEQVLYNKVSLKNV